MALPFQTQTILGPCAENWRVRECTEPSFTQVKIARDLDRSPRCAFWALGFKYDISVYKSDRWTQYWVVSACNVFLSTSLLSLPAPGALRAFSCAKQEVKDEGRSNVDQWPLLLYIRPLKGIFFPVGTFFWVRKLPTFISERKREKGNYGARWPLSWGKSCLSASRPFISTGKTWERLALLSTVGKAHLWQLINYQSSIHTWCQFFLSFPSKIDQVCHAWWPQI